MSIFEAIVQGILQGLTEFLPISSSGHLAISEHILGMGEGNLFFNVMLHLGTLLAVCTVYYKLIGKLISAFIKTIKQIKDHNYSWNDMDENQNLLVMLFIGLIPLFLLFIPIPFGNGLTPKDLAEIWAGKSGYLIVVGMSLLITSVLIIVGSSANKMTERAYKKRDIVKKNGSGRHYLNVIDAFSVGFAQMFAAIFPGLSRSGSTLAIGEMRGLNKQKSLDYGFILGIPSIIAASLLEGKEALDAGAVTGDMIFPIIIGVIVSAIVGFIAILFFRWMLMKDRMYIFVAYTAIVGAIIIVISCVEISLGVNIFTGEELVFI